MKKIIQSVVYLSISIFVFIFSCEPKEDFEPIRSGQFTLKSHELNGITVNELIIKGDWIFAATKNGVYGKRTNVPGEKFRELGLQNNDVLHLHAFTTTEIIASVVNIKPGQNQESKIFQTVNGGNNWNILTTNFGGTNESFKDGLSYFSAVSGKPNELYAAGHGSLAKSVDKGRTWELVWGEWGMAAMPSTRVSINPIIPDEVWIGGQGSIENGYLVRLKNNQEVDYWTDLVPNPTVVKEIVFDRENPQTVYVGWEGELAKSTDNGKTWQTLINRHQDSHFFFGIGLSPSVSTRIYTAKWKKGEESQKLELYHSDDKGVTWKTEEFSKITQGGVWDLKVIQSGNKDRIFLGLYKGGIVEIVNESVISGFTK